MDDCDVYCFVANVCSVHNASDMCCPHNGNCSAHNQRIGYNSHVLCLGVGD